MKKWEILSQFKIQNSKQQIEDIIKILLENRGVKSKQIKEFLNPKLENIALDELEINKKDFKKAIERIYSGIKNKERIVVFGDYDADGICASAILWESLNTLGANVMPYIPHRIDEGYGLSIKGIDNLLSKNPECKLVITVDNGIVAKDAVDYANKLGLNVIITDHHAIDKEKLPKAFAIIHTTKVCGAGVAWALVQEFLIFNLQFSNKSKSKKAQPKTNLSDRLELVAIASVADMVPLVGATRTLVKYGLEEIRKTKRPGLLALFEEAGISQTDIDTYTVGHIISPRLNASGRLEYAMESLRLLCTKDKKRGLDLARKLGRINRERQELTVEIAAHAKSMIDRNKIGNLLFIAHESYRQGVIGLAAGKLVEEFYRPAIVIAKGEKLSKASARSISGFNIVEFIRGFSEHLVDIGGHPMAAGFTVETEKLQILEEKFSSVAEKLLNEDMFVRTLRIDAEIPFSVIDFDFYNKIQVLAPFGVGNPEPVFLSSGATVEEARLVGAEGRHIKLKISCNGKNFEAIAFGMGKKISQLNSGKIINIVYSVDQNEWRGNKKLQLKVKDFS